MERVLLVELAVVLERVRGDILFWGGLGWVGEEEKGGWRTCGGGWFSGRCARRRGR